MYRFVIAVLLVVALATPTAFAWERGLNAGSWTKGATLNVYVDAIPADAPAGTADAIAEAIKEWNDAQAPLGGLKLVSGATKANADIHISWGKSRPSWGSTHKKDDYDKTNSGFGKETVRMEIEYNDGLNARGITRVLKHEFGHAEGLGHSAKSDLMKEDAYSSNPGKAPSAADLNAAGAFTAPTDDDKAGKKALWGTAAKNSKSNAGSGVLFDGIQWEYRYRLDTLLGIGLTDAVTEFTLDMLYGIGASDFTVLAVPNGWQYQFLDGYVDPAGKGFDDGDWPSPSLLNFTTISLSDGLYPGQTGEFRIASRFSPATTRAFTNSPGFDSDEFVVYAPMIPEPFSLTGLLVGAAVVSLAARRRRR